MSTDGGLNFFCTSMYGAKRKQGMVQIQWDNLKTQLSILGAKKIAYTILEAAEGAATDEALMELFSELKIPVEVLAALLKKMRDKRGSQDPRFFED